MASLKKEKSELHVAIEQVRRELKLAIVARQKIEEEQSSDTHRHEKMKLEIVSLKECIVSLEEERTSITEKFEHQRTHHRHLVAGHTKTSEELRRTKTELEESHCTVHTLRSEIEELQASITRVRGERTTLIERAESSERHLEEFRHKYTEHELELTQYKRRITTIDSELKSMTKSRDTLQIDVNELRTAHEELQSSSELLQLEIEELNHESEHLRVSIREATEQRERAIASRERADAERDEYVQKYEEKCRQMERFHDRPERPMSPVGHNHHHSHSSAYERVFGSMREQLSSSMRSSVTSRSMVASGTSHVHEHHHHHDEHLDVLAEA
jgi:chromosome segregation ATPase